MENITMLLTILLLAAFVIGSLIHEYFYEIRYAQQKMIDSLSRVLKIRKDIVDDTLN